MTESVLAKLTGQLLAAAAACNHRRALVFCGDPLWCRESAVRVLGYTGFNAVLWISEQPPGNAWSMAASKAHKALGQEVDGVVFDAHSGFDADAFGAVAGAVHGGGLLILLTPLLAEWPAFADPERARITVSPYLPDDLSGRFLGRLTRMVRNDPDLVCWEQGEPVPLVPSRSCDPTLEPGATTPPYRTPDQQQAVEAVRHVVRGHRRRPLVLVSDRGRGKSATFGIAAAQLLKEGLTRIIVTGPRWEAVEAVFTHAAGLIPDAERHRGLLRFGEGEIVFVAPDVLALGTAEADLLLVDEAAGIPTALLSLLLRRFSRIAFATTVHGYEGTGRGFALRFNQVLSLQTPGWRRLELKTPVRWSSGDPLERFVFDALLLNASGPSEEAISDTGSGSASLRVQRLDRDALANDERLLGEVFGLLVLAHYRTRPYDLRQMLDGPNLSVWAMFRNGVVIATALIAAEGGLDARMSRQIFGGWRRLRGHLIPQSLVAHCGVAEAAGLSGWRVMRLAVHPSLQGRGLGSRLLGDIEDSARRAGADWLGASFGATESLLRFWGRAGFHPVRVGVTREASSGAHAALVLKPLSNGGQESVDQARRKFGQGFAHLLSDPLRDLAPELAVEFMRWGRFGHGVTNSAYPLDELRAFAFEQRGYEDTLVPIWHLVVDAFSDPGRTVQLPQADTVALVAKVLQKRRWGEVAALLSVPGRSAVIEALRVAVGRLLEPAGGGDSAEAAES